MAVTGSTFDQNNSKYHVLCKKVHVRLVARAVSVILALGLITNLIYSVTRSMTVVFYSWVSGAFAVGVYGSLLYGVFKEKKMFTLPYLMFQATFMIILGIVLLIFIFTSAFSSSPLETIAEDFGGYDFTNRTNAQINADVRSFSVIMILLLAIFIVVQLWFFEVIYRFYHFLKDRETSFNFHMDTDFRIGD
uniref:Uncharacterized protein n=1 Tax=Acrobeloides nanus TaxID=290746 RepID=A0A914DER5_9BILA